MSSAYTAQYYTTSGAMPMAVPQYSSGKEQYGGYYATDRGGSYSVSPPESVGAASATSGVPTSYSSGSSDTGSSAGYSSGYASYSAAQSYAGSTHGEYESTGSFDRLNFPEYVEERMAEHYNPISLDNNLVQQAQTSGKLNAKQRQMLELQKKTQARLARARSRMSQGLADASEVHTNLAWTHEKVTSLQAKASKNHSKEYKKARARYPSPDY